MTAAQPERIVCGTDFTENAAAALRWAGSFARRIGGTVDLVTAVAPVTSNFPELSTDAAVLDAALHDQAAQRLAGAAAAAERELGVPVEGHVVHSDVAAPIAVYAEKVGARAIVVGAHRHPPLERWLLGSVADRTIRAARCPVVVVPPPPKAGASAGAARGAAALADPTRRLRVLVGLDGGAGGDRALGFARELCAQVSADVTFLHLYWPFGEYQRLGLQGSRDLFEPDADVVRNLEPGLRKRIGMVAGAGDVALVIRPAWGEPAANLLAAADEGDFDLLVVGAEQRHGLARLWHPSATLRLVARPSGVPVVCVPAPSPSPHAVEPADAPAFSTILVPTDLSPAANQAVPYACALLGGRGGALELCHVHQRSLPNPPFSYDEPRHRLDPRQVAEIEERLRALVPATAAARGIRTHVSVIDGGHAGEAIVQAAERLNVDAICLASHGHGGLGRAALGSVAESVVRSSRKPVLVVRPGSAAA